jgi:threonine aldolase
MRTFRSDNNSGICPEAFAALEEANADHVNGYGDDHWTEQAVAAFYRLFGSDAAVYLVATGTAANVLALAALTEPWQQIICHTRSHYNDDESTAPERVTHCRAVPLHAATSKLTAEDVYRICANGRGDVHQPAPGAVTLSNSTELGEVYTPDEVRAICEVAHEHGYRIHMDGARFANAVAALGVEPAVLTREAGIDALSFGGTKNGLAFGEAIVFFPQGDGGAYRRAVDTIEFHRKGFAHLLSKHRFVAAPFARTLSDGAWLRHAGHANAMARRLSAGFTALGLRLGYPTEANGVFVHLPDAVYHGLTERGHGFYPFGEAGSDLYRLMCSFDTTADDVDAFLRDVESCLEPAAGSA